MLYRIMSRGTPQRLAACLALLAMIMMFAGPLISQLKNDHHIGLQGHHHGMDMAHAGMLSAPVEKLHQGAGIFHWFDQCGYCSLWQHFPAALGDTFLATRDVARPLQLLVPFIQRLSAGVPVFPNALSRAPPAVF